MEKGRVGALLPIGVFLVLYLGLGILFEYGMGITMGFYNIPIVVIFLIALLVACFQQFRQLVHKIVIVLLPASIGGMIPVPGRQVDPEGKPRLLTGF